MARSETLQQALAAVRGIQAYATTAPRVPASIDRPRPDTGSETERVDLVAPSARSTTAFVSWAHSHSAWTAQKSKDWQSEVATFAATIRQQFGIDADVDLFHADEPTDWTRFGPQGILANDKTIIVMSEAWAERWSGTNSPTEGAGAAAEADTLRGLFQTDQAVWQRRIVIVTFPEVGPETVPPDLVRIARVAVDPADIDSYEGLVRLLTEQPAFPKPPLGSVPFLPPFGGDTGLAIHALRERLKETTDRLTEIHGDTSAAARLERRSLTSREATLRGVIDAALRA